MAGNADRYKVLSDFRDDCKALDLASFEKVHGDAFLLHHGSFDGLKAPVDGDTTQEIEQVPGPTGEALRPAADFLVLPLSPGLRPGAEADMIWLGRSDANEVIVPDATVSEVHAFVRREATGYQIQDTGSRNGTWVNDIQVQPQGRGDPVPLSSGARVRLGSVKLTFLQAEQFRSLVLGLLS